MKESILMKMGIKTVVAIGIGTALFVALSYVQIPSPVPNTSIQSRMAIIAFFAAIFGPVAGLAIGFIGHALADAVMYGSVWWSWVIAEGILGFLIGIMAKKYQIEDGKFELKQIVLFNIVQIIANAICWIGFAPVLDILIYAEPADKVFLQGAVSVGVNILTIGIIGTALLLGYAKTRAKSSTLTKGE